jgi:hypothetical protein
MTLVCAVVRGLGDGIHRGLSIYMNRSAYDERVIRVCRILFRSFAFHCHWDVVVFNFRKFES